MIHALFILPGLYAAALFCWLRGAVHALAL